jgi:hypothetical protein
MSPVANMPLFGRVATFGIGLPASFSVTSFGSPAENTASFCGSVTIGVVSLGVGLLAAICGVPMLLLTLFSFRSRSRDEWRRYI